VIIMFEDKIVIVTGATGNLGRVLTKKLLDDGATVVTPYRNEETFNDLKKYVGFNSDNLFGVKGDCAIEENMNDLARITHQEHGRIDALFNLVGGYEGGDELEETSEKQWNYIMDLNLKTNYLTSKAVLPYMKKQRYGKIVSVAAKPGAENTRRRKSIPYAVSKSGVIILTEGIAEEVKDHGINANCVVPNTIDTPDNRKKYPKADFEKWVKPEEIADVMMFLASDNSKPTNGAVIPVYGKG
jgi:NAD(P)-dependent dehydrogenase (short-subunit alcohol dehydrogenase family)